MWTSRYWSRMRVFLGTVKRPYTYTSSSDGGGTPRKRSSEVTLKLRSSDPWGIGEITSSTNWNSPVYCFDVHRTRVGGSQSRTSGSYGSILNRGTFVHLYYGELIWVGYGVSLRISVVSYVFVFRSRFSVVEVSYSLVIW